MLQGFISGALIMVAMASNRDGRHLLPLQHRRVPYTMGHRAKLISAACYVPCCLLMFEWFSARRGLASGVMYAGTGAGGTIFPFVMTGLLNRFGYKTAMICMGIGFLFVGSLALWPIRRRVPLPTARKNGLDGAGAGAEHSRPHRRQIDWSFAKKKTMVAGVMTIMLTSCGNFIPSVWLPSRSAHCR